MEMIRQYLGYDPSWTPMMKWGYTYSNVMVTHNYEPIKKPQELVMKYIAIRTWKENPILLAA